MLTELQKAELTNLHGLFSHTPWGKFMCDFDRWERDTERRLLQLELHGPPTLSIWDLGCGLPYFVHACQQRGHQAYGVDYGGYLPRHAAELMGVPFYGMAISLDNPFPREMVQPNLVTMYGMNLWENGKRWGWPEYEQYAGLVMERLTPGGRLVIEPNRGEETDFVLDAEHWNSVLQNASATVLDGQALVIQKAT